MSRPTDPSANGPFVHERRIRWGESDPARIAYTARFLDFAMDAIEAYLLDRWGASYYELNVDHGRGTPFVKVELEFRSPLTPRDTLATEVRVARIGGSSTTFVVAGRVGDRLAYEGRLTCAYVDVTGERMRPVPIPDAYRAAMQRDLVAA